MYVLMMHGCERE